jgi:hypothetical protein
VNPLEDCLDEKTKGAILAFREGIKAVAERRYNEIGAGEKVQSSILPESSKSVAVASGATDNH